jgi:hypothetical protein
MGIHGARIAANPEQDNEPVERDGAVSVPRAGSEPLHHRSVEHKSGYGGEGGEPRTSSHERQNLGGDSS